MTENQQNKSVQQLHVQQKQKHDVLEQNSGPKLFGDSNCANCLHVQKKQEHDNVRLKQSCRQKLFSENSSSTLFTQSATSETTDKKLLNTDMQSAAPQNTYEKTLHTDMQQCRGTKVINQTVLGNPSKDKNRYLNKCHYTHTTCHKHYPRNMCVLFKKSNYNFNHETVNNLLVKEKRLKEFGAPKFICKNCHKFLQKKASQSTLCEIQECVGETFNPSVNSNESVNVQKVVKGRIPIICARKLCSSEQLKSIPKSSPETSNTSFPTCGTDAMPKKVRNNLFVCVCTCCH